MVDPCPLGQARGTSSHSHTDASVDASFREVVLCRVEASHQPQDRDGDPLITSVPITMAAQKIWAHIEAVSEVLAISPSRLRELQRAGELRPGLHWVYRTGRARVPVGCDVDAIRIWQVETTQQIAQEEKRRLDAIEAYADSVWPCRSVQISAASPPTRLEVTAAEHAELCKQPLGLGQSPTARLPRGGPKGCAAQRPGSPVARTPPGYGLSDP